MLVNSLTSFTITLTAAVFFSLLLSLSLIPTVCAQALKTPASKPRNAASLSDRWYSNTLRFTFKQPLILFGFYAVLLSGIAFIVPHLGTDLPPVVDEGSYMLDYLAPAGSSLSETDSVARILEQILKHTPEVVAFTRRTGAESGLFATETNKGDIQVTLQPSNKRKRTIWQIMDEQREETARLLPNADIYFHQILQDELNDLSGVESQVSIKIFGENPN